MINIYSITKIHPDFSKAKALSYLIKHLSSYIISDEEDLESVFNTIAQDIDEYDIPYIDLTYQEFINLNNLYLKDPLLNETYYLQECAYCSLDRTENPRIRESLESLIQEFILNYDQNQNIIITDLASGYLLQIFIIISKIINLNYRNITLNIIDNLYTDITLDSTFSDKSRNKIDFTDAEIKYFNNTIHEALKSDYFYLTENFTDLVNKFILNNALYQFKNWFDNLNINLTVNLFDSYNNFISKNNTSKSHILTAIDYSLDNYPELFIDWNNLREKILDENSYSWSLSKELDENEEEEKIFLSHGTHDNIKHLEWDKKLKKFI